MQVRWMIAGIALALSMIAPVKADPIDWKQVDANAKWVVGIDLNAIVGSNLAQKVHANLREKYPDLAERIEHLQASLPFIPVSDFHDITIYGLSFKKQTGVAIVNASPEQKFLLDLVANAPNHHMTKYKKYEIHTWTHGKGAKHERCVAGAFFSENVLIFSGSADEVMAALNVLDGKKPSLNGKSTPLTTAIPDGAVLTVRAIASDDAKLPAEVPPVIKKTEALSLSIGENEDKVFMAGHLTLKDAETADLLKSVIEGGRAAILLANSESKDYKEIRSMIRSVEITSKDKTVGVTFKASSNDVESQLQRVYEKVKNSDFRPPFGPRRFLDKHPADAKQTKNAKDAKDVKDAKKPAAKI
jgi:hypothetical protein